MGNNHPKLVVIDGDVVMREAIKHVFPDTCHRLCAWHLHKNACENVKSEFSGKHIEGGVEYVCV
uniref:MULE transposase domain-containing protein n=1 Tax=Cajanus cajan TaxID=3821 RepID=A0A151QM35_CAJCA|nr:hypothetical protein KK1_048437 [Cajanus cajan]